MKRYSIILLMCTLFVRISYAQNNCAIGLGFDGYKDINFLQNVNVTKQNSCTVEDVGWTGLSAGRDVVKSSFGNPGWPPVGDAVIKPDGKITFYGSFFNMYEGFKIEEKGRLYYIYSHNGPVGTYSDYLSKDSAFTYRENPTHPDQDILVFNKPILKFDSNGWGINYAIASEVKNNKSSFVLKGNLTQTDRLIIWNSGEMGIGREPISKYKLSVDGDIDARSYQTASDERLKTNIHPLSGNLLYKLRGISYQKKSSSDKSVYFGFIAQEMQKVYPEAVSADDKGYLSINYLSLIPVCIEAMKDQQKAIDRNQKIIDSIKSRLR